MRKILLRSALVVGLLTSGSTLSAQMMSVLTVHTDNIPAYAALVGELNRTWKAEKVPVRGHLYVPVSAGDQAGEAYFVSFPKNGAEWLMLGDSTTSNPAAAAVVAKMDAVRDRVANSLYIALLDGGIYDDGVVYVTFVRANDTGAYIEALGELDDLLSANGLDDARLSAYSAIAAGDGGGALQVILSLPNPQRMGVLMDAMGSDWLQGFLGTLAPMRTILSNGIFATVPTE